jgi:PTH1 family peptidyl-tRNA hydrolase
MKLIVGLGNPGDKYTNTRHNIGFKILDEIAGTEPWKKQAKSLVSSTRIAGKKVILAKPQTYMNLSGEAILPLQSFYKWKPEDILVVVDDINLDIGKVRLRDKGSHGGQNGLRDIIQKIGPNFHRLRIGVGPVPPKWDVSNFVLSKPAVEESKILQKVVADAGKVLDTLTAKGMPEAMALYNGFQWKA